MGGCASVSKAMRAESTEVPPPERPKEETSAAATAVQDTAAAAVMEETKAEGEVVANRKEMAVEVDALHEIEEIEEEQSKIKASSEVALVHKEKKSDMAGQK